MPTSPTDLVLGIDVGTTGTKTMLVADDGAVVAEAYAGYALTRPRALVVEQDAEDWWRAVVQTVRQCVSAAGDGRVRSMALSAQGGSLLTVDDFGRPLAPARSWLDRRAGAQTDVLSERFGATALFERTGWRLFGAYNAVQLLDMRAHDNTLFKSATAFLGTAEYLYNRLTGRCVGDVNSAGITQLTDARAGDWDDEILDFLTVERSRLPELHPSGTVIGRLTADAADALGLSAEVEVVLGGHDQYCAALGAGVTRPGDLLVSTGTAWVVLGITAGPVADPRQAFGFGPHVIPGVWGQFGSLRNGGVCLDWARGMVGSTDDYPTVERAAATVPPGAEGLRFFPHFDGTSTQAVNDAAKGTMLGLELRHGKAELYRAVMEGVCFELRRVIDGYEAYGPTITRLTVGGGAANSPLWTQIVADVLGRHVEVSPAPHSACTGAAILAGVGAQVWPSVAEACAHTVSPGQTVVPSADLDRYQGLLEEHLVLNDHVVNLYAQEQVRGSR